MKNEDHEPSQELGNPNNAFLLVREVFQTHRDQQLRFVLR